MTQKKFSLSFINKGKPFVMPKWTVGKHRAAMSALKETCKGMANDEKEEYFNYLVIMQTLKQVDSSVTLDDIKELHPEDMIRLFEEVYNAGKEGIYFRDSPKKKVTKTSTKKSTGTKK